jgi:hypothetical protein
VLTLSEPDYAADMALPEGKTCADCVHIRRCAGMGFSKPERTSCDFWPNKFHPSPLIPANAGTQEEAR